MLRPAIYILELCLDQFLHLANSESGPIKFRLDMWRRRGVRGSKRLVAVRTTGISIRPQHDSCHSVWLGTKHRLTSCKRYR